MENGLVRRVFVELTDVAEEGMVGRMSGSTVGCVSGFGELGGKTYWCQDEWMIRGG